MVVGVVVVGASFFAAVVDAVSDPVEPVRRVPAIREEQEDVPVPSEEWSVGRPPRFR